MQWLPVLLEGLDAGVQAAEAQAAQRALVELASSGLQQQQLPRPAAQLPPAPPAAMLPAHQLPFYAPQPVPPAPPAPPPGPPPAGGGTQQPRRPGYCYQYAAGCCTRSNCQFSHDLSLGAGAQPGRRKRKPFPAGDGNPTASSAASGG
jgi:hypothetical protein